jgi:polyadenylate-binding protein
MRYDDLAALSPVVRREVLTGELSRRVKTMDVVPTDDIDKIVRSLVTVSLSEVIKYIEDPNKLKDQVLSIQKNVKSKESTLEKASEKASEKSPSPVASASASNDSSSMDPNLIATASAPEHPSTPVSISATSTPPRTSSPSGSVPPVSERDRMLTAVSKLESSRLTELTDLLMTLPKRERAMCLFNVEVLRAKLADAKLVLDSDDEPEEKTQASISPPPCTPQSKKVITRSAETPRTPDLSSRGASATSSPLPTTPGMAGTKPSAEAEKAIAALAKLPADEVIKIANSPSTVDFPLPKPDPAVVQGTDDFIDGLQDKLPHIQKQQLGDKLYVSHSIIKGFVD